MNLGYLFTDNSWGQFDALPLPLQAIEIHYMKKQCQLYLERYQKNCGLLGAPNQKHSEETIISIIDEIEKIRAGSKINGDMVNPIFDGTISMDWNNLSK